MDFKSATDILTKRLGAAEIAAAFDAHPNTIARARVDPASSSYRSPPGDWRRVLAQLARERGSELATLAEELEKGSE